MTAMPLPSHNDGRHDSRVILYDRLGCWTRQLRPYLSASTTVDSRVSLNAWTLPHDRMPTVSFVVLDADDELTLLRILCQASRSARMQHLVLAVGSLQSRWGALLIAAGVVYVDRSLLATPRPVADVIHRFCRRTHAPTLSLEQRIWKNLPWWPSRSTNRR